MHARSLISKCIVVVGGVLLPMVGCQSPPHDAPRTDFGPFWLLGNAIPDQAVVTAVRGKVKFSRDEKTWLLLEKNQLLSAGSVIRCGSEGEAHLTLAGNSLDLLALNYATLILGGLEAGRIETNVVADVSLKLVEGVIEGDVQKPSPFSMYEVVTPNVVFIVPGRAETRFQAAVNGVAHVIRGSLAAVYISPATEELSSYTVNQGQSFVPPLNGNGRALPAVRPTRKGELYPRGP